MNDFTDTEFDFTNAIKNPFAESIIKNGYTVTVHHKGWDEVRTVTPEEVAECIKKRDEYLAKMDKITVN